MAEYTQLHERLQAAKAQAQAHPAPVTRTTRTRLVRRSYRPDDTGAILVLLATLLMCGAGLLVLLH